MATAVAIPDTVLAVSSTVRTCYDVISIAPACGVTDFTDGKYVDNRNDEAAYLAAQQRQAEYLLDQLRCRRGTRLLDIGCGYGRVLEQAAKRGARPIGITISPPQVAYGRARGLNVFELNYRNIFRQRNPPLAPPYKGGEIGWAGAFDAIVANGSLEHFVQPVDAAAGKTDEIYEELFEICHQLLAAGGRLVTTAIHFRRRGQFDPREILRGPNAFPARSSNHQFAMLAERFGGWYPEPGQLERCAAPHFELVDEEDGTHDYHLTSEYWLRRLRRALVGNPRVWWGVGRQLWHRPRAAWEMLRLHLWDQAWCWQFRPPAPMQLLRQTWQAR